METKVVFNSDGIELGGEFSIPTGGNGQRLPGIVLAHGFAGARYPALAAHLSRLGYGVLAFDFRGYGKSGGDPGNVLPREQVSDIKNAVTWLTTRPEVNVDQIGVIGSSLGGSVAIMATAEDARIKACVAGCPLGHGDSTLRKLYTTESMFQNFMHEVASKKQKNQRLHRFEIVFIPENLRESLPGGTPMSFSADTVYGFLSMNPAEVIAKIAPRPIFIIHAEDDHVVPVEDSVELKSRAGGNCDLQLVKTGDHFIFNTKSIIEYIGSWMQKKLPTTYSA